MSPTAASLGTLASRRQAREAWEATHPRDELQGFRLLEVEERQVDDKRGRHAGIVTFQRVVNSHGRVVGMYYPDNPAGPYVAWSQGYGPDAARFPQAKSARSAPGWVFRRRRVSR